MKQQGNVYMRAQVNEVVVDNVDEGTAPASCSMFIAIAANDDASSCKFVITILLFAISDGDACRHHM